MIYSCPFNYVGGKSKLLPVLLPLLKPYSDRVFVDLFGGGFSVGLNVTNRSIIYNDINTDLTGLIRVIKEMPFANFEKKILTLIDQYELSKTNQEGYNQLRQDFNKSRDPFRFCLLIFHSFNHQIRYNNNLQFNTPFGKNRSWYNPGTQRKLKNFAKILQTKEAQFISTKFQDVRVPDNAIVYADPPYLVTTGSYNDGSRGVSSWNELDERELYEYLDGLNSRGIPFVLSNMLKKGNYTNVLLDEWKNKYHFFNVDITYKNYQRKNHETQEIIVTNMKRS